MRACRVKAPTCPGTRPSRETDSPPAQWRTGRHSGRLGATGRVRRQLELRQLPQEAAQLYLASLEAHPLLTKAATCFCCTVVADAMAQALGGLPTYDARRSLLLGSYAGTVGAVTVHAWHRWLEGAVSGASAGAVAKKVALDQLLFAPFQTLAFFAFLKLSEGQSMDAVVIFAKEKLPGTLLASYSVWPAVNVVLFARVPTDLRVLYGNLVGVCWSTYLCMTCVNAPAGGTGLHDPDFQVRGDDEFVVEMAQPVPVRSDAGGGPFCAPVLDVPAGIAEPC